MKASSQRSPSGARSSLPNQSKKGARSLFARIMSVTLGTLVFITILWLGVEEYQSVELHRNTKEWRLAKEVQLRFLKVQDAEKRFMLHSLHTPMFFELGTDEDFQRHRVAMRQLQQQIRSYKQISTRHALADQLTSLLSKYDENFKALSIAYRTRGYKDWGQIGKFRDAVHALERAFTRLNHQALMIEMLQLRRSEKDYLLRHEPKYPKLVSRQLTRLRVGVRDLDATTSIALKKLVDDYETAFHALLEADKKIGLANKTGLYAKMQDSARNMRPVVGKIVSQAAKAVTATEHQVKVMIIPILILGTLTAIAVSALASRTMVRPLVEILHATERVAKGDFSVHLSDKISARDEIGKLAASFEHMVRTLQRVAKVANEISSGNYSDNLHPLNKDDVLGIALANMTKTLREKTEDNQRKTDKLKAAIRIQTRFRAAMDISPDAIFLVDRKQMRFIDMNETACASMGYSRDELLTMGPHDIKPNLTEAELTQKIDTILESEEGAWVIETQHCRKDGSTFPVEIFLRALKNEEGTIFVASVRDLTERKQSEAEITALHGQVVDAARQAGMAEVATSVLHNVGNVLNSVNVSAGLIHDKIYQSGTSSLTKVVDVIEQHLDDLGDYVTRDERGKHLPRFLIDLNQRMTSDEQLILEEVHSLRDNINHIKAIVETQQSYATGMSAVVEQVSLAELIEDAIHINAASIQRHLVKVDCEFDDIPTMTIDKQKFLQIVVNLISNAKYACLESNNDNHQLTVSLRRKGEDFVSVEVRDNGIGIAEENRTKIFAHGFTTRKEGHGFGLHSAVLAAKELGGRLTADSDGLGTGATFTLDIPYQGAGISLCRN